MIPSTEVNHNNSLIHRHQPARPCSLVRFTAEQYLNIKSDAITLGRSIPQLLRDAYFDGRVVSPLLAAADAERLMRAINRIGNNINQIAKHINSGFEPLLEAAVDQLTEIRRSLVVGHERR
jgi:hypothetical protein